ncbi:hypothetical protein ACFL6M_00875 [Candidatus Eisenbacteria bacterium]|uniref:Uncharacterized protein n=1 Tax=Eiseniibacteriota bacterium TaxID=2212470 RepID=A0ABV6YIG8_UNCEI
MDSASQPTVTVRTLRVALEAIAGWLDSLSNSVADVQIDPSNWRSPGGPKPPPPPVGGKCALPDVLEHEIVTADDLARHVRSLGEWTIGVAEEIARLDPDMVVPPPVEESSSDA